MSRFRKSVHVLGDTATVLRDDKWMQLVRFLPKMSFEFNRVRPLLRADDRCRRVRRRIRDASTTLQCDAERWSDRALRRLPDHQHLRRRISSRHQSVCVRHADQERRKRTVHRAESPLPTVQRARFVRVEHHRLHLRCVELSASRNEGRARLAAALRPRSVELRLLSFNAHL